MKTEETKTKARDKELYLEYKRGTNNPKKIKDIDRSISRFLNITKKERDGFGDAEIIKFLGTISHNSINHQNDVKVIVKEYCKFIYEDYSIRFRNLAKLCRTKKPEKTYTPEQMVKPKDFEKIVQMEERFMWKTFLLVFYYGGFRPVEVVPLEWDAIVFQKEGCFIKIKSKKNGETFNKYLPENVSFYLKKLKKDAVGKYVFPSKKKERKGLPITTKAFYFELTKISKKALGRKVNPYMLRHSIATELYSDENLIKKGLTSDDIARQLGHSQNMKKTYTNLDDETIKNKARKIYIKSELTPETKEDYEKKIDELRNELRNEIQIAIGHIQAEKDIHNPLSIKK